MGKIVEFLDGKKTYILAALAAVAALVNFIAAGHFGLQDWIALGHSEAMAAIFATLRAGIAKKA